MDLAVGKEEGQKRQYSFQKSFGSARPPSSRGSNARRSEDRRQVLKEVSCGHTNSLPDN